MSRFAPGASFAVVTQKDGSFAVEVREPRRVFPLRITGYASEADASAAIAAFTAPEQPDRASEPVAAAKPVEDVGAIRDKEAVAGRRDLAAAKRKTGKGPPKKPTTQKPPKKPAKPVKSTKKPAKQASPKKPAKKQIAKTSRGAAANRRKR